ncbi:phosphoserine aminotransferase [Terasakiella brassicae]|uniref:Phosphoserine aminotransferase n=1 Tax=Terasakiella brassicae TaxID=1634917 RepID=A0A917FE16_9PROT|nr:3-phosphoserine/phosphohydroxythreonine transaminase [Terasakiella brassicae]GGF68960.1 phosphoserine aminotransferase [Terasakiella brassicae]
MVSFNFGAGPAVLPGDILEQARAEAFNWQGSGMSLFEIPFGDPTFGAVMQTAHRALQQVLNLPDSHHLLFLQGGAYAHFAFVAMNLMGDKKRACYLDTGHWSKRAIAEASKYGEIVVDRIVADGAYCHMTTNETTQGRQFHELPDSQGLPLVADMTSDILTRPIDFSHMDLVYASAQKNIAPAGLSLVIMHEKLFDRALDITPTVFNYTLQARNNSRVNTPNLFGIYMAGLMAKWVTDQGGLPEMAKRSREKSAVLYETIDHSRFFHASVNGEMRSHVNVCFGLKDPALNELFLQQAQHEGLLNLNGHSAGAPLRASLYNALPRAGVVALADFIKRFDGQLARVL